MCNQHVIALAEFVGGRYRYEFQHNVWDAVAKRLAEFWENLARDERAAQAR